MIQTTTSFPGLAPGNYLVFIDYLIINFEIRGGKVIIQEFLVSQIYAFFLCFPPISDEVIVAIPHKIRPLMIMSMIPPPPLKAPPPNRTLDHGVKGTI